MSIISGQDTTASDFDFLFGTVLPYAGRTAPTNWLMCDGAAVNRTTYAGLFNTICPSIGTFTVTIASPGVFTLNSHGLFVGDTVYFTTTGALPTGLAQNTLYYVSSVTTNTFQVTATSGGTSINTSGTQSGVHTVRHCPYGLGDGSTTFNVPDMRARTPVGMGTGTKVATFVSRSSNVITVTGIANNSNNEFQTAQAVFYHTSGSVITGLTNDTTYYVVRVSNTTISLASSLANAQNGTVITLTSDGTGIQTFTQTYTTRALGQTGGEENHAMSSTELLSHFHVKGTDSGSGNTSSGGATSQGNTNSTGGNAAMNIMQPFMSLNYIIRAI